MRKFLFLVFLSVISINVTAQECFQWKNLKLKQSSLDETVRVLGKPKEDRVEKPKYDKTVTADDRERLDFRKLRYKKIDGYREVDLLFLNERLFSLEFTPDKKKLLAADLNKNFDAEFLFAGGLSTHMKFADYEGQKETTVPKVYPSNYYMLAVNRQCAILATIDNDSWQAIWRDSIKKPTVEMFPGTVKTIQIFSRETKLK